MHRFFLSPEVWHDPEPTLDSSESHHCSSVLRHKAGDRIAVFDGAGREAIAVVQEISRKGARLSLGPQTHSVHPSVRLHLAQAVPKGKNMDLILQKAVELGAARITPLLSERTVVDLKPEDSERKAGRWKEVVMEACKQCGQNHLPEVAQPSNIQDFLQETTGAPLRLIGSLQPDAIPLREAIAAGCREGIPSEAIIMVGPEGDFTPVELAAAKSAGYLPVSLGPIVLRSETAAIFCLSILAYELFTPPTPAKACR
jgi:16S rRNA (uracil1498-N3)-methyltransferase